MKKLKEYISPVLRSTDVDDYVMDVAWEIRPTVRYRFNVKPNKKRIHEMVKLARRELDSAVISALREIK